MQKDQLLAYPFTWLDQVIEITLNPAYYQEGGPDGGDFDAIRSCLPVESRRLWSTLKQQSFAVLLLKRRGDVVAGYYDYLVKAREQVVIYVAAYPDDLPVSALGLAVLEHLDMLLEQIRGWYGAFLPSEAREGNRPEAGRPAFKILCRLSVDQIAIVLKAADEVRLLTSRSFSLVLRTLVPFLSTERLNDFSWKSARSNTYKMEGTDKQIAIHALEALIEKIREY